MARIPSRFVLPDLDRRAKTAAMLSLERRRCKRSGTSFRKWVKEHTSYAYSTAVKLARVGDKHDIVGRLLDIRARNNLANRRYRAGVRTERRAAGISPLTRCKVHFNAMTTKNQAEFKAWLLEREH